MRGRAILIAMLAALPAPGAAESVVAARMLRAQTVIVPADVALRPESYPGALTDPAEAVGLETRVNIYAGRPIRAADLAPPAVVERNQIVTLRYFRAGIAITTEGRALDRAGAGARIRVMNLASRSTVTGTVLVDGSVRVATADD